MRKFARVIVPVVLGLTLLIIATPSVLRASWISPVPEIEPTSGMSALALLAGVVLMIRARRNK